MEEGINEGGAFAAWLAAATSYLVMRSAEKPMARSYG
jgi:pyruvate dehydrogenase complex dehydrogenase (E1) component